MEKNAGPLTIHLALRKAGKTLGRGSLYRVRRMEASSQGALQGWSGGSLFKEGCGEGRSHSLESSEGWVRMASSPFLRVWVEAWEGRGRTWA